MSQIFVIDRKSRKKQPEKVFGEKALACLYGKGWLGRFLLPIVSRSPVFSVCYGFFQKLPWSKRKILPFIRNYDVDATEFLEPVSSFGSFNDFFIRRLKPEARPIDPSPQQAMIPADGRYLFYQNIEEAEGFVVKGQKFCLTTLLGSKERAAKYKGGSMVIGRLAPPDYHRFHFPCDCVPGKSLLLNGWLYSVNPLALRQNVQILSQNKRMLCDLKTDLFGDVLYLEIGATNVGTIRQTYSPFTFQPKGAEKGYFQFGGSCLILLFEKDRIQFDSDLLISSEGLEIRCLVGQSMGKISHA